MTPPAPTAEQQLAFLRNLRRLLDEGMFVATYKYALLHAIADLCVTDGSDTGAPLTLSTRDIADQFVRLYWRQAVPFPGPASPGDPAVPLKQNTGRQAAILRVVKEARAGYDARLGRLEASDDWSAVLRRVEHTVRRMPLWKLQTIGSEAIDFLYENRERENPREITLRSGVAFCFRAFYPMVTDMVQGAWTQHIRRTNEHLLGTGAELRHFLFGTERADLSAYREALDGIQVGECFYCRRRLRPDSVEVDHFVAWRRYPVDLAHNFVLAHKGCNAAKADRLAAVDHLRRWTERNHKHAYELPRRFDELGLQHDRTASVRITRWAYEQVERSGGQVWVRANELVPLGGEWRQAMAA